MEDAMLLGVLIGVIFAWLIMTSLFLLAAVLKVNELGKSVAVLQGLYRKDNR